MLQIKKGMSIAINDRKGNNSRQGKVTEFYEDEKCLHISLDSLYKIIIKKEVA